MLVRFEKHVPIREKARPVEGKVQMDFKVVVNCLSAACVSSLLRNESCRRPGAFMRPVLLLKCSPSTGRTDLLQKASESDSGHRRMHGTYVLLSNVGSPPSQTQFTPSTGTPSHAQSLVVPDKLDAYLSSSHHPQSL